MMITTILNIYKRPNTLKLQIDAIREQSTNPHCEIWIWKNFVSNEYDEQFKKELDPFKTDQNIHLIDSSKNFKYHARFALALLAKTPYVAIFDDDTIPGKNWFKNCLEQIIKEDGLYGTVGIRFSDIAYQKRIRVGWPAPNASREEVDLVGHAWFFKTENLKYLWFERPIDFENGEDIQLSYSLQKYANLKTFVPPHPHDRQDLWGSVMGNSFQDVGIASWRNNTKSWYHQRDAIMKECISRGWKLWKDRRQNLS